jgi:GNAT superfamily N-acetyltransferase
MRFEIVTDPGEFRERTRDLLADEARHNLIRGILGNLIDHPDSYESYRLMVVSDQSIVAAAGLITPPYNLIVADTADDQALQVLVAGVADAGFDAPGVVGNEPTVSRFVAEWCDVTRVSAELSMAQGVFALDRVTPAPPTMGSARVARSDDLELVLGWMQRFVAEAIPDEPQDDDRLRSSTEKRLRGEGSGALWIWDVDGRAVSLSGHGSPTGSGIRIGPVYTPPEHRANGYATSLVAAQSAWLLENGYAFCFLFTDLANPTSNRIYESIGYRRVAESASYRFINADLAT